MTAVPHSSSSSNWTGAADGVTSCQSSDPRRRQLLIYCGGSGLRQFLLPLCRAIYAEEGGLESHNVTIDNPTFPHHPQHRRCTVVTETTFVVPVTDDGGSSRAIRDGFGGPAVGDARNVALSLATALRETLLSFLTPSTLTTTTAGAEVSDPPTNNHTNIKDPSFLSCVDQQPALQPSLSLLVERCEVLHGFLGQRLDADDAEAATRTLREVVCKALVDGRVAELWARPASLCPPIGTASEEESEWSCASPSLTTWSTIVLSMLSFLVEWKLLSAQMEEKGGGGDRSSREGTDNTDSDRDNCTNKFSPRNASVGNLVLFGMLALLLRRRPPTAAAVCNLSTDSSDGHSSDDEYILALCQAQREWMPGLWRRRNKRVSSVSVRTPACTVESDTAANDQKEEDGVEEDAPDSDQKVTKQKKEFTRMRSLLEHTMKIVQHQQRDAEVATTTNQQQHSKRGCAFEMRPFECAMKWFLQIGCAVGELTASLSQLQQQHEKLRTHPSGSTITAPESLKIAEEEERSNKAASDPSSSKLFSSSSSSFSVVPHLDLSPLWQKGGGAVVFPQPLWLPIVDLEADFFTNQQAEGRRHTPPVPATAVAAMCKDHSASAMKATMTTTTTLFGQRRICYPHSAAYDDQLVTVKEKEEEEDVDSFVSLGCAAIRWKSHWPQRERQEEQKQENHFIETKGVALTTTLAPPRSPLPCTGAEDTPLYRTVPVLDRFVQRNNQYNNNTTTSAAVGPTANVGTIAPLHKNVIVLARGSVMSSMLASCLPSFTTATDSCSASAFAAGPVGGAGEEQKPFSSSSCTSTAPPVASVSWRVMLNGWDDVESRRFIGEECCSPSSPPPPPPPRPEIDSQLSLSSASSSSSRWPLPLRTALLTFLRRLVVRRGGGRTVTDADGAPFSESDVFSRLVPSETSSVDWLTAQGTGTFCEEQLAAEVLQ